MRPEIMVIEDDDELRATYCELFKKYGFSCSGFADGKQAMVAIKEKTYRPSLIILDYLLPNMNGKQLLDRLSLLPGIERIPVIVISVLTSDVTEIAKVKGHPWVMTYLHKAEVTQARLIHFVQAYFDHELKA